MFSKIYVKEINGGIALSNSALEKIKEIKVIAKSVITVENLTTYHDEDEERQCVYLSWRLSQQIKAGNIEKDI